MRLSAWNWHYVRVLSVTMYDEHEKLLAGLKEILG